MAYLTVNELKAEYPRVDYSAYADLTLETLLERAKAKVDNFVGYSFEVEDVVDEIIDGVVSSDYSLLIFTNKIPVNSVASLKIVKGSTEVNVNLTSGNENLYTIPSTKDRIIIPLKDVTLNSADILDFASLKNATFYIKVSYNAGYSDIPSPVKEATALYVLDSIARGANITGANKVSQGGISIEYTRIGSKKDGKSDLVLDAESILQEYKKVVRI